MTLPDQLTQANQEQLARQIAFFQALTIRAFDSAERIVALNIEATRATIAQTSGAMRQLAAARDPHDFAALAQPQQQMEAVLAYGRKLMDITNKPAATPPPAAAPAPAPEAHIVTAAPVMVAEPVAEPVAELVTQAAPAPEPAASTVAPSAHPMGEAAPAPAPAIAATPKTIARAARKVAAAPAAPLHPAASPIPDAGPVALPAITPADAGIDATAGAATKRARGSKKR